MSSNPSRLPERNEDSSSVLAPITDKVLSLSQVKRLKRMIVQRSTAETVRSASVKNELRMNRAREEIGRRVLQQLDGRMRSTAVSEARLQTILGNEYLVRLELDLGLHPVDERDRSTGHTLLTEAASRGHFPIVRMLLKDFRADPNLPTLLGSSTPLHLAVIGSHRPIAALLIIHGADLEAEDRYGCCPLHLVSNMKVLRLLLKHGANILKKNKAGLTPLQYYLQFTNPERGELSEVGIELQLRERQRRDQLRAMRSLTLTSSAP